MTDFFAVNKDTIVGTPGDDRLTVTYNADAGTSGVLMQEFSVDPAGGYMGWFDSLLTSNDVFFSGIEHFTFIDQAGGNDTITTGNGKDSLSGGGGQ